MSTPSDLIGTTEAGRILGKSNRTIHRLVEDGRLTIVVVAPGGFAGSFLFDRAEVEKLKTELDRKAPAS